MKRKFDTLLLTFALLGISGAMLAYNLRVAEGGELTPSPSELIAVMALPSETGEDDTLPASALPDWDSLESPSWELLEPIIVP